MLAMLSLTAVARMNLALLYQPALPVESVEPRTDTVSQVWAPGNRKHINVSSCVLAAQQGGAVSKHRQFPSAMKFRGPDFIAPLRKRPGVRTPAGDRSKCTFYLHVSPLLRDSVVSKFSTTSLHYFEGE